MRKKHFDERPRSGHLQLVPVDAERGPSVDAQLTLGHLHYHGARGLPADVDKAFAYYMKAAQAGEPTAYSHLGNMFAQGIGAAQDNKTALEVARKLGKAEIVALLEQADRGEEGVPPAAP